MLCGTSEIEKGVQVGTCTNRWYDKLQIIVCKNGSAGINFEHTGVDGHTVLRLASDVYTDTILRFARTINGQAPSLWSSTSPDPAKRDPNSFGNVNTTPHKLEWDMLPELRTALRFAETRLADLIQQNEFRTLEFAGYGKNFMTSMGFSPDAFVQMAFQAAYYGLYGRVECCYEPAMTKVYFHGRTESIRSVTPESVDFVRTFWAENPPAKKIEALKKACEKHTAITKVCAKGEGQDRHLYALFCVWQRADEDIVDQGSSNGFPSPVDGVSDRDPSPAADGVPYDETVPVHNPASNPPSQQMPAIFADAGWDKLNNTILSTSNCGNPALRQFGFGPTSGEGFGIGYIIKDDSVSICASSKHRQTKRFVDAIEAYFLEVRRLLRATRQQPPKGRSTVRDAEDAKSKAGNVRNRGRSVHLASTGKGADTPGTDESQVDDDDGLGGYGFFDAGMLLQALKARGGAGGDAADGDDHHQLQPSGSGVADARRNVGKKLRLAEY
ncbi:MAG: hypothetical protein M1833_006575 [Piccolia ochrophora]|nr:MAG: hypothetical protein M1833_006575 [Piccolia ochrophora]